MVVGMVIKRVTVVIVVRIGAVLIQKVVEVKQRVVPVVIVVMKIVVAIAVVFIGSHRWKGSESGKESGSSKGKKRMKVVGRVFEVVVVRVWN